MLPLPKIEEWHHGGFLVLWRVAFEDLIDKLLAYGRKLERYLRIVIRGISVLKHSKSIVPFTVIDSGQGQRLHTTNRAELPARADDVRVRHWGRSAPRDEDRILLQTNGRTLDAIVDTPAGRADIPVNETQGTKYLYGSAHDYVSRRAINLPLSHQDYAVQLEGNAFIYSILDCTQYALP